MYCAFSEEILEVLSQRESIRRQLASETGTGQLFITYLTEKTNYEFAKITFKLF
jgi:hypothetical protein